MVYHHVSKLNAHPVKEQMLYLTCLKHCMHILRHQCYLTNFINTCELKTQFSLLFLSLSSLHYNRWNLYENKIQCSYIFNFHDIKKKHKFCYSIISSDIFKMLYKLNRFLSSPKVFPSSTLASYFKNKALISSTRLASPQDLALAAANLVLGYWQVKHDQKMLQSEVHSN